MRRGVDRAAIAVFAKAPVAGFAKTRLIPEIGVERAAELQARLIEQAVATAQSADLGPVSLWCAPSRQHKLFQSFAETSGVELYDQVGADLGARMLHAFKTLTPRLPTLLIGTDCPALRPDDLSRCLAALQRDIDAVFIPAEDGGYVLAAMKRPHPELFSGISWGTSEVMEQTRARAVQTKLRIAEPATLWDLDNPADYRRALALGLI
jgi:rSAM/selenodomain-associated transferase 1